MSRRLIALSAVAAISLVGGYDANAGKAPKPQTITFYAHGTNTIGEQDQTILTGGIQPMNRTKPTGSQDKGKVIEDYVAGPNKQCTANGAFPNWAGDASGTIVGKATVTFFVQNNPGATVDVRLFADGDADACTSSTGSADYYAPVAEKSGVALPATGGKVSVTLPVTAKGKAAVLHSTLVLEILPGDLAAGRPGPEAVRVLYDSTASPTAVTFSCLPKPGKKSC